MAGGQGTKLWPYSTDDIPKQFQTILGETTLFQMNVKALLKAFSVEDIFISTKKKYVKFIKDQTPEILEDHILAEPDAKKNMGPGTIYAVLKVDSMYPGEPFMVVQSDCIRDPEEKFIEMIKESDKLVRKTKQLISGGARPHSPIMGIDYFQLQIS